MKRPAISLIRQCMTVLALSGMIFQVMLGLALPAAAVTTSATAYLILCSSDAQTRTIAVDADGQIVPDAATHDGHCDVCLMADIGKNHSSVPGRSIWYVNADDVKFPGDRWIARSGRFSGIQRTRAPPVSA